jgi:hypothetical protein
LRGVLLPMLAGIVPERNGASPRPAGAGRPSPKERVAEQRLMQCSPSPVGEGGAGVSRRGRTSRQVFRRKPGSRLSAGARVGPPHPARLTARCPSPQTERGATPLRWRMGAGGMRWTSQIVPLPARAGTSARGGG